MIVLRSLIFNTLFYLNLIILMILGLPAILIGRNAVFSMARLWARSSLWLLEKICGLKAEIRGIEKIPAGAILVTPKHQSFWETFALCLYFDDFSYILKRELRWIPLFGWYLYGGDQIAINRGSGRAALAEATAAARKVFAEGRQIIIFPEGTRRPPGAPPAYKYGATHIYGASDVACLPVALNAGLFWPRRKFIRRPGTIVVEFLDPIPPGLDKAEFARLMEERIETASNRLLQEAVSEDPTLEAALYQSPKPA